MRIILLLAIVLFSPHLVYGQQKIITVPCESKLITLVEQEGLRALNGGEIFQYYIHLMQCNDKQKVRLFRKKVEQRQLLADLEKSKHLQGFTSGIVYSTFVILIYYSLN